MSPVWLRRGREDGGITTCSLAIILLGVALLGALAGCLHTDSDPGPSADPAGLGDAQDPTHREGAAHTGDGTAGFTDADVFPGNYSTNGWRSKPLDEGPYTVASYEVHQLDSKVDDTVLEVGVARPDVPDNVDVPVIVVAGPHFASSPPSGSASLRDYERGDWIVDTFVPHGYTVALHPIRGADGDGACAQVLGPRTAAELDQLATWLGTRDWSNGNVSFVGLSSHGTVSWLAASTANPHIETIIPIAGRNDLFTALFRNGTWAERSTYPGTAYAFSRTSEAGPSNDPAERTRNLVCPEAATATAETAHAIALGRPGPTGFWSEHTARNGVEEAYEGSIFAIHGFEDAAVNARNLHPWVQDLAADGTPVKLWLGQWGHDLPDEADDPDVGSSEVRWDFAETLLHWFDYWLRGERSVDLGPPVQVQDSQGAWRSADAWPPSNASESRWYLAPGGDLVESRTDDASTVPIGPAPSEAAKDVAGVETVDAPDCSTCLRFASDPLDESLRFAGSPRLELTVTPVAPGGYVTVDLLHRTAKGTKSLSGGQAALTTIDGRPGPVQPGQTIEVEVPLDPVDAFISEGSSIELVVSQSSHEGFVGKPAPFTVHVGGGQSTLSLQSLTVQEDRFFHPPAEKANDLEGGP